MIVFLCTRGSGLRPALASASHSGSLAGLEVRDLDAPLADGAVTIATSVEGERVVWQGLELTQAAAIVVERPLFAWPQALTPGRDDRAARALLLSALHAAALRVPVIDAPASARWAALPTAALAELAHAGLDVHPWTASIPPANAAPIAFDVAGADLGYEPRAPRENELAWWPEPFDDSGGPVQTVLVAGERVVGGAQWPSASAWAHGSDARVLGAQELATELAQLAPRAARTLGVANLELDFFHGAVLRARSGPDLSRWNSLLGGRVVAALLECASGARRRT